jgi:SAM-dependent methyltransferase
MNSLSAAESLNRKTMRDSVRWYSTYDELNAPERTAFAAVAAQFSNKRILDLGVGAGRTTPALLQISSNYTGIDYVPEMVAQCRNRFAGVRFEHADARSMQQFADRSFDLIVFACNGVSMVDHAGRKAILNEVRRLLDVGGVFIFSTYNRNSDEHDRGFELPAFTPSWNPLRLGVRAARFMVDLVRGLGNRLRYRRYEVRTEEYTIRNDRCHHYATMLYYISMENQFKQLLQAGFPHTPEVYDGSGQRAPQDTRADSLTYVVRG